MKTFNRLIAYLWRYKKSSTIAILFILLSSVTATVIPLMARYYIDTYIDKGTWNEGYWLLIVYYSLFLLRVLLTYIGTYAFSYVSNSVVRDLRQEAFSNMQKLNMTYFDTTPAGAIVSRLTNDTQAVSDMFSSIFSTFLSTLFIVVATLSAMFSMNVGVTILMVLFIPVMFASVKIYNHLSHSVIRKTREKLSEINVKLA